VVIGDGWYAALVASLTGIDETRWAFVPRGPLRGVVLGLLSIRADRVFLIRHDPGWRALLALRALFGVRRKLVALHFIEPRPVAGWRGRLDRWATRRAVLAGQALTSAEAAALARRYDLPRERFPHVPFALRRETGTPPAGQRDLVVAAGRAGCDWPTLFAAADGAGWPLVAVCGPHDAEEVRRLGGADVRVDLPGAEVRDLLRRAAVSVIAMRDTGAAQGHVRLADAVDAGAAIVVSDVAAVREYVEPGVTALVVAPGDAAALRADVERLLGDPALRARLTQAALDHAARRPWDAYLASVAALVLSPARDRAR
jgi:glycosyltransferase involved in cell wall biosynthesis